VSLKFPSSSPIITCLVFAFLAGCRTKGSYIFLLASSLISVILLSKRCRGRINTASTVFICQPLLLLAPYTLFVFVGEFIRLGFGLELRAAGLSMINIPLLSLEGTLCSIAILDNAKYRQKNISSFFPILLPLSLSSGALLSSIWEAVSIWISAKGSVVALRPSETLFVVGLSIIVITLLPIARSLNQVVGLPRSYSILNSSLIVSISIIVPILTWLVFRGSISLLIAISFCISLILTFRFHIRFLMVQLATMLVVTLLGSSDRLSVIYKSQREVILRYLIYPFVTSNPLNGRMHLFEQAAPHIIKSPLIGISPTILEFKGMWAHNIVLDTILYHGWVTSFLLVAFSGQQFIFLIFSHLENSLKCVCASVMIILYVGALLQPVEFSDGIAYQISFYILGLIFGLVIIFSDANVLKET
jgi:hypothetical protein